MSFSLFTSSTFVMLLFLLMSVKNEKFYFLYPDQSKIQFNETDTIDWNDQFGCLQNLKEYVVDKDKWSPIRLNFYRNKSDQRVYYLTCAQDEGPVFHQLDPKVDIQTYQIDGEFAHDKYAWYSFFLMSSGVKIIPIRDADHDSFRIFPNTRYATDNSHVYYRVDKIENADPLTFEPIFLEGVNASIGRDKNHIYLFDQVLQDTTSIDGLEGYLNRK